MATDNHTSLSSSHPLLPSFLSRYRYEPSTLAAIQAATIPESEMVAGKHPLVTWKILKDKSAVRLTTEAERLAADIAAAGIKTTKDRSGKLSVNGIEEEDVNTAVKLLAYTAQTSEDAAGRVTACRITSIEKLSGYGEDDTPRRGSSSRSFESSVAVGGEIFLVGSKSDPMVFSISVDISLSEYDDEVQDESNSVSFQVKDPNNVECDIFNGGSNFDPDEKVAAIQQEPARVFGPDKITDKEIRLLTLKEPRETCRYGTESSNDVVVGEWDEDEAGPLLALLVDACEACVGKDLSHVWNTWIGEDY